MLIITWEVGHNYTALQNILLHLHHLVNETLIEVNVNSRFGS